MSKEKQKIYERKMPDGRIGLFTAKKGTAEFLGYKQNANNKKKGNTLASQIGMYKKGGKIKCSHNRLY